MFPIPSNAKSLIGGDSPHLLPLLDQALSQAALPQYKPFFQNAAAILSDKLCTDTNLFINQIVLKKSRERVANDPILQKELQELLIDVNNSSSSSSTSTFSIFDEETKKNVESFMEMLFSERENTDNNNNQKNPEEQNSWIIIIHLLKCIENAAEKTTEFSNLKSAEKSLKNFKERNRSELPKIYNSNNLSSSSSPTSYSSSPTTTSFSSSPTTTTTTSSFEKQRRSQRQETSSPTLVSTSSSSSSPFSIDIHKKSSQTNLLVIKAQHVQLKEDVESAKHQEQNSPVRLLLKQMNKLIDEAKSRSGLNQVEKWQQLRDQERGKTGNEYGEFVEDNSWDQCVPFLLASDEGDNLGEAWSKMSSQEKIEWWERCQTMTLSEEELKKADTCVCPKCLAKKEQQEQNNNSNDQQQQQNSSATNLSSPAVSSPITPTSTTNSAPLSSNSSFAGYSPTTATEQQQQQQQKCVAETSIRTTTDRDASSVRERFKLFRRYCWRMKLPFLRIFRNVAYSSPPPPATTAQNENIATDNATTTVTSSSPSKKNAQNQKQNQQQQKAQKGELDGVYVNICHKRESGMIVLAVIEVKLNPADLVYARNQREKFLAQLQIDGGSRIKFSTSEADKFGKHCLLHSDRFSWFVKEPVRRWIFCTVNKKNHLSLPFYSKIAHHYIRAMASVASHSKELPPLPSPLSKQEEQEQEQEVQVSTTSNASAASASSSKKKSKQQQLERQSEWLKDYSESVRKHYSNWNPTPQECKKIVEVLWKAWNDVVVESGASGMVRSPNVILEEDEKVRSSKKSPGNIVWIDLEHSPSSLS